MSELDRYREEGLLTDPQLKKLRLFSALLLEWNPRINLTGFRTIEDIEGILIGEAVAAIPALGLSSGSVLDIGSGAGIPGLVWAICIPCISVTSLEIRQKKVAFQKEVLRQLDLSAKIMCGHFPEAVFGRNFDCIVSRAIRLDARIWNRAESMLSGNGVMVRFAGASAAEDGWRSIPVSCRSCLLMRP